MALQGTLDTFSLPDVLRLLATTGKTGCLHVDGDRGRGKVWIDDGALVGATADRALGQPSIDEVVFEMLRIGRGSFRFAVDEKAPDGAEPSDIEGTLRRASQLLEEWRELEAVVPSLSHRVAMAPELTVEQVTVDAERWKALVAIASGRSVGELAETLGVGELGISRTVSDLVELGVAVIEPPGAARTPSAERSSRRNVTDIASRSSGDSPRRSRGDAAPRREPAVAPTSDGAPQVNWAQTAEPIAAPDNGGGLGRQASSTRMSSTRTATAPMASAATAAAPALDPVVAPTLPSSRAAAAVGVVTPAAGTPSIDSAPKARRPTSTSRSTRPRRANSTPAGGQAPVTGSLRGSTLPVPPPVDVGLAAMPAPLGEPTTSGPIFPPSLETSPPSGLLLPPSLDTGRLGPSPMPMPGETGQIPAVSATALPPDLSWAAEDNEAPIGPPPMLSSPMSAPSPLRPQPAPPSRLLSSPPPAPRAPMQTRHEGDVAAHVMAMSSDARQAVEAAVGRSGGGPGGMPMAGASQEQILSRGQLFHYLSSIRG